jgi:hypothetical protein
MKKLACKQMRSLSEASNHAQCKAISRSELAEVVGGIRNRWGHPLKLDFVIELPPNFIRDETEIERKIKATTVRRALKGVSNIFIIPIPILP